MAVTYSNLKLAIIADGTEDGTWGNITNANITVALEEAVVGQANVAFPSDANYTLPWTNTYATQTARNYVLDVTGSISTTRELIVPAIKKPYLIQNNTTGGQSILVKTLAGSGVTVPNGKSVLVYTDAVDVVAAFDYVPALTVGAITLTSALPVNSGGTGATSFTSGGLIRGNGTSALSVASAADIVTAIGATAVTNATNATTATTATTATNIAGGAANRIAYNTGAGATGFINAPTTASTYLQWNGSAFDWTVISAGGVTSVTGTAPVVSSGGSSPAISLAANYGDTQNPYASKNANFFLAAPSNAAGVPTFRAIVAADIPTLNQNTTGNAATATLATTATNVAGGGANQISYNTASGVTGFIAAPTTASTYLSWNGSAFTWASVASGGVTSISGTSNQVIASASTGAVTLSLPQAIATSSNVQFGGLGVGTAGSAGAIRATGNITAYYSDDRLKTRLGNVVNAIEKVLQLDAFYYEANEVAQSMGYEKVREVGLSAQQVQAVLPEIVKPAPIDEKYLTIDYERVVPLLVQAIKELASMIPGGSSANPGTNKTEG